MTGGYTQKQAERVKHRIDLEMAKIEDAAARMRALVTDIGTNTANPHTPLEELREVAHELKATVDRRTRGV